MLPPHLLVPSPHCSHFLCLLPLPHTKKCLTTLLKPARPFHTGLFNFALLRATGAFTFMLLPFSLFVSPTPFQMASQLFFIHSIPQGLPGQAPARHSSGGILQQVRGGGVSWQRKEGGMPWQVPQALNHDKGGDGGVLS